MQKDRFSDHLNEVICSEHPPSSDFSDKKQTPSSSSLLILSTLSLFPIKKQTESQINPLRFLCSAAIHISDCARPGKSLELFTPPLPKPPHNQTPTLPSPLPHTFYLHLPLLLPFSTSSCPTPLPSSAPLQNEMPMSDRLSQFADPCGTVPSRPGHCASRSLAKRRGIIFIPQTGRYAPMISNACLAHCQGWFWTGAKPIILISLSLYFNSYRQCRFTAEHIREIKSVSGSNLTKTDGVHVTFYQKFIGIKAFPKMLLNIIIFSGLGPFSLLPNTLCLLLYLISHPSNQMSNYILTYSHHVTEYHNTWAIIFFFYINLLLWHLNHFPWSVLLACQLWLCLEMMRPPMFAEVQREYWNVEIGRERPVS